jgi:hypothetical protein
MADLIATPRLRSVLCLRLDPLNYFGGEFTLTLNLSQVIVGYLSSKESLAQNICRHNRILDCVVNPDTANTRAALLQNQRPTTKDHYLFRFQH